MNEQPNNDAVCASPFIDLLGCRVKAQTYSSFGMATFTGTVESVESDGYLVRPDEQYTNLKPTKVFIKDIVDVTNTA